MDLFASVQNFCLPTSCLWRTSKLALGDQCFFDRLKQPMGVCLSTNMADAQGVSASQGRAIPCDPDVASPVAVFDAAQHISGSSVGAISGCFCGAISECSVGATMICYGNPQSLFFIRIQSYSIWLNGKSLKITKCSKQFAANCTTGGCSL